MKRPRAELHREHLKQAIYVFSRVVEMRSGAQVSLSDGNIDPRASEPFMQWKEQHSSSWSLRGVKHKQDAILATYSAQCVHIDPVSSKGVDPTGTEEAGLRRKRLLKRFGSNDWPRCLKHSDRNPSFLKHEPRENVGRKIAGA